MLAESPPVIFFHALAMRACSSGVRLSKYLFRVALLHRQTAETSAASGDV